MICKTTIQGIERTFDLDHPIDISIPITESHPTNAFHLPAASFTPFVAGDFVGSVEAGGPVRCDVVTLATHGNGTHTECVGHIAGRGYSLIDHLKQTIVSATLITVPLDKATNCISREALIEAWQDEFTEALIVRTEPNDSSKRSRVWSGDNPPYFNEEAMREIVARNVKHLLVDLPSVDPEEDAGELLAHHIFWNFPDAPRVDCTITELVYIPNEVPDDVYLLSLNAAAFDADAAPSRPMMYAET